MTRPRVLSVGQCSVDHATISGFLGRGFDAVVTPAATAAEALALLRAGAFDLVLVNRVGDRDGASGLDLIRTLKSDEDLSALPVMLVSNYADAQAQSVALGALPGFGKAEVGKDAATERLRPVLVEARASS